VHYLLLACVIFICKSIVTSNNMNWYKIFSFAATACLFLPIIFILALRLFTIKSFLVLLIYYFLALAYNLMVAGMLPLSANGIRIFGLAFNFLDAPLILFFLLFFTSSWRRLKQIRSSILIFLAFELLVITLFGFNFKAATITLAPGILLNLFYCSYFFYKQTHIHIVEQRESGKTLMLASILFAYGCFFLIYLFHYVMKTDHKQDEFLVFNIVTTVSSIAMATGIWIERNGIRPSKEVNLINEKTHALNNKRVYKTA